MPIRERQLKIWSAIGAQVRSPATYKSIKHALANHAWPSSMDSPLVYLQGSYRNHTNIAGNSDVDVVVETSRMFYSDLSFEQLLFQGYPEGRFTWRQFRDEVWTALAAHYGSGRVRQGEKCIHVDGAGDRLNADVVPCCEYRRFGEGGANGITFWTGSGIQVVNFPECHYHNGTAKNEACRGNYKRMIRVFKNARNAARLDFPSYFLESMLYNVSSRQYSGSLEEMFVGILRELSESASGGSMMYWTCQNGQQPMFGNAAHQINVRKAHQVISALVNLWNKS